VENFGPRFVRAGADQVPGAEAGTAGLGLPLAAEIASVHGGTLLLANPGKPGARFECWIPVAGT
jgi:signal transduction histidine kinase